MVLERKFFSGGGLPGVRVTTTPEQFGAKRNGKSITDAAITNGQTTLTSATAAFTSADIGKYIKVTGAELVAQGSELVATIDAVTNATTVTLSVAASQTVSGARATYGNDDAAAIESAIGDAVTKAIVAGHRYAEVVLSPGIYMVSRAALTGAPYYGNAQIRLPVVPEADQKVILSIRGGNVAGTFGHWNQVVPQKSGVVLYSTLVGGTNDGTWSAPSCIGGPTNAGQGGGFAAGFSNMLVHIDGITVVAPKNPSVTAFDFGRVTQLHVGSVAAVADQTPSEMNAFTLTQDLGLGMRVPRIGNNHYVYVQSFACEGFYYGTTISDHYTADRVVFVYTNTALFVSAGGANEHGASILNLGVEATDTILEASLSSGGRFPIYIAQVNTEVIRSTGFKDTNDALVGYIGYTANDASAPTVTGCGNLKLVDLNRRPGAATAPGIPTSAVAFRNPFWRDAAVRVSGGTVTAIAIDGVSLGMTTGTVIVPTGKTITLTYSVAPSWVWTLL